MTAEEKFAREILDMASQTPIEKRTALYGAVADFLNANLGGGLAMRVTDPDLGEVRIDLGTVTIGENLVFPVLTA